LAAVQSRAREQRAEHHQHPATRDRSGHEQRASTTHHHAASVRPLQQERTRRPTTAARSSWLRYLAAVAASMSTTRTWLLTATATRAHELAVGRPLATRGTTTQSITYQFPKQPLLAACTTESLTRALGRRSWRSRSPLTPPDKGRDSNAQTTAAAANEREHAWPWLPTATATLAPRTRLMAPLHATMMHKTMTYLLHRAQERACLQDGELDKNTCGASADLGTPGCPLDRRRRKQEHPTRRRVR
jgi:hypothetical protein